MNITVIGEANIDIAVRQREPSNGKGCSPAYIRFHHGGVARNVAHNLCLLGHKVKLMTVFGDDDFASRLIDDCKEIGMDLSLSTQYNDARSPIFLCFNDECGQMQSAFSDIDLNDHLNLDWMRDKIDAVNRSDLVVADTLLSAEALTFLIDHCVVPLYIDTVSPKRALLLSEAIKQSRKKTFFAVKCNLAEAQALTGITEAEEAARQLNIKGIENVYLTLGKEGAIYCSNNALLHFPAMETKIVNVTGSGDAFLAGVVHGHALGQSDEEAVRIGLKMAQLNTKSEAPVNPALRHSTVLCC